ncbi:pleckstrin homology domain-containing family S member 1-like [Rhinichthys klamathensis goyatoka]|uniref:pleckstrin homology domain-containing family S member 1-like n=1 Tax=Rhinichthys klamathensis goyatoka TaxID=3034132 RepID=UPI0024B5D0F3|nr:pleckstrin homology domain-containing family S member 1-like [Rhinichthys klamathensis goyatoka]
MVEEVYTGYLHKSPAQPTLLKTFKSWKRRFFVLSKTGEDACHLTYYTNNEKRDKPVGEINISKIILISTGLETQQMRDWIQKHFKCPPSSVLFLRVEDDTHKNSRDYFLIGEDSDDVNGWYKALNTQKSNQQRHTFDTIEDSRFRSDLEKCPEPKVEDQSDDKYEYVNKFSEPPVPVAHKISVNEDKDEKDGKQDESPENSNEYMQMASVQMALEDVQPEADTACIQTNTSINGHESSVCNGAINQDTDDENKRMSTDERHSLPRLLNSNGNCGSTELNEAPLNKSEMHTHVEKEICISQNSLKNSLILKQEEGKPCVSECRQIQDSLLFHKGDQILAFNDLLTDTVEEIQTYLRRLSKDEVKLTIRRFLGSQPLHSEPCTSL